MINKKEDTYLIRKLLKFDLERFSLSLGLIDKLKTELSTEDAINLLNLAERYSRNQLSDEIKMRCLYICGLIWEHRKEEWTALPMFLMKIITRLGLSPTTKMVGPNYDVNTDTFGSLGSFLDELYITSYFLKNEITLPNGNIILLSNFQKNIWQSISEYNRLGISAPTSAGKSFVLINKIVELILNGAKKIIYIVPTLSLINQVTNDLRKAIKENELKEINICQTYTENEEGTINIFVLTQERAMTAINLHNIVSFEELDLLIVDEVQNIERVANEGEERAYTLYDVIMKFENDIRPKKIIISGPRLKNLHVLVNELFGDAGKSISDDLPPVVNLTYSFTSIDGKVYINQYSPVYKGAIRLLIEKEDLINLNFFQNQQYNDSFLGTLKNIVSKLDAEGNGTIVFAPTSKVSIKMATAIAVTKTLKKPDLDILSNYIRKNVHLNYSLIDCIAGGVAYHHGKMPSFIRAVIEKAFADLLISTIVCTTTLMQGINLPAKNIIARNPNLFTRKNSEETNHRLTGYEFANLRGRAGRLMKDFVGRSIVLDEPVFERADIDLSEYPQKEIKASYEERFTESREELMDQLISGTDPSYVSYENDLMVYIRQSIITYKDEAILRLRKTGVNITRKEFLDIRKQLEKLSVPTEICVMNRFWDPNVLNSIYLLNKQGYFEKLPKSPFDNKYVEKISRTVTTLKQANLYYFDKYFNNYENEKINFIIKLAQSWSQEKLLKDIIGPNANKDSSSIDSIISCINSDVMYNLPKLLKPISSIQDKTNPVLGFMEIGAFRNITRRMIEIGIHREQAVKLVEYMDSERNILTRGPIKDDMIIDYIKSKKSKLDYWDQRLLEDYI